MYDYRVELQAMEDACHHPEKHTPAHSHGPECWLIHEMLEQKIRAIRATKRMLETLLIRNIPAQISADETTITISGYALIATEHEPSY